VGEIVNLDDLSADVLTGSEGYDWFFFKSSEDRVTDLTDKAFERDLLFMAW